jgi:hypothetical protein
MKQTAPDPGLLHDLVRKLTYKAGWQFTLADIDRGQGSEGLTLTIKITVPDSYKPGQDISVLHYMIVPPAAFNRRSWQRWLLTQILLVEQHEVCEFFKLDGHRPYAPNHGPGNDPYTIMDQGTPEDAQTTFRGERFVEEA